MQDISIFHFLFLLFIHDRLIFFFYIFCVLGNWVSWYLGYFYLTLLPAEYHILKIEKAQYASALHNLGQKVLFGREGHKALTDGTCCKKHSSRL